MPPTRRRNFSGPGAFICSVELDAYEVDLFIITAYHLQRVEIFIFLFFRRSTFSHSASTGVNPYIKRRKENRKFNSARENTDTNNGWFWKHVRLIRQGNQISVAECHDRGVAAPMMTESEGGVGFLNLDGCLPWGRGNVRQVIAPLGRPGVPETTLAMHWPIQQPQGGRRLLLYVNH